jgi:hypothetical protein
MFTYLSCQVTNIIQHNIIIINIPKKNAHLTNEHFSLVSLEPSIYNQMVVEIVRWNDIARNIGLQPNLLKAS